MNFASYPTTYRFFGCLARIAWVIFSVARLIFEDPESINLQMDLIPVKYFKVKKNV